MTITIGNSIEDSAQVMDLPVGSLVNCYHRNGGGLTRRAGDWVSGRNTPIGNAVMTGAEAGHFTLVSVPGLVEGEITTDSTLLKYLPVGSTVECDLNSRTRWTRISDSEWRNSGGLSAETHIMTSTVHSHRIIAIDTEVRVAEAMGSGSEDSVTTPVVGESYDNVNDLPVNSIVHVREGRPGAGSWVKTADGWCCMASDSVMGREARSDIGTSWIVQHVGLQPGDTVTVDQIDQLPIGTQLDTRDEDGVSRIVTYREDNGWRGPENRCASNTSTRQRARMGRVTLVSYPWTEVAGDEAPSGQQVGEQPTCCAALPIGTAVCLPSYNDDPATAVWVKVDVNEWRFRGHGESEVAPNGTVCTDGSFETTGWRIHSFGQAERPVAPAPAQPNVDDQTAAIERLGAKITEALWATPSANEFEFAIQGALRWLGIRAEYGAGDRLELGSAFSLPNGTVLMVNDIDGDWVMLRCDNNPDTNPESLEVLSRNGTVSLHRETEATITALMPCPERLFSSAKEMYDELISLERRLQAVHNWCGEPLSTLERYNVERLATRPAPLTAPSVGDNITFPLDYERALLLPAGSLLDNEGSGFRFMVRSGDGFAYVGHPDTGSISRARNIAGDGDGCPTSTVVFIPADILPAF